MLHLNGLIHDINISVDAHGCAQTSEMTAAAAEASRDALACAAYFGGNLGRLLRMPFSDRVHATKHVIERCKRSGKPILVECGALSMEQTQTLVQLAISANADGISLMMPMFFGVTAHELETYCETMLRSIPEQTDVYFRNDQRFSNNRITAALFRTCAKRFPQLKGLIDDSAAAENLYALPQACGCCVAISAETWPAATALGFRAFIS